MAEVGKLAAWLGQGKGFEIREYPVPDPAPGAVVIKIGLDSFTTDLVLQAL